MRRFEFVGGASEKFWEIDVADRETIVRFGRIDSRGTSKTKRFANAAAAMKAADSLIAEKVAKGYSEIPYDPVTELRKAAWTPKTKRGDSDKPVSKFGGRAWIEKGTEWPACSFCASPERLLV